MLTDEAELKKRELSWRDGSTIQHIKKFIKTYSNVKGTERNLKQK